MPALCSYDKTHTRTRTHMNANAPASDGTYKDARANTETRERTANTSTQTATTSAAARAAKQHHRRPTCEPAATASNAAATTAASAHTAAERIACGVCVWSVRGRPLLRPPSLPLLFARSQSTPFLGLGTSPTSFARAAKRAIRNGRPIAMALSGIAMVSDKWHIPLKTEV